jgi:type IV pilus biogenesis protein CpaD/CtpE
MRSVNTGARALLAGLAAAALLAGCNDPNPFNYAAQPIGSLDRAEFRPAPPDAQFSVAFLPGRPELAPGQAELLRNRLRSFVITPGDEIRVTYGLTGSSALDRSRVSVVRSAVGPSPAPVRVFAAELGADVLANSALVQVQRYGRLTVECPGTALNVWELDQNSPMPPISLGCSNAVNRATQASVPRDLLQPRPLRGSEGVTSAAAVKRHEDDEVKFIPLDDIGN